MSVSRSNRELRWSPDRVFDWVAQGASQLEHVRLDESADEAWSVVAAPNAATAPETLCRGDVGVVRALGEGRLASVRVVGEDLGLQELYTPDGRIRPDVVVLRAIRTGATLRARQESATAPSLETVESSPYPTHCFELAEYRSIDMTVDGPTALVRNATASTPPQFAFTETSFRTLDGLDANFPEELTPLGGSGSTFLVSNRGRQLIDTGHLRVDPSVTANFQVRVRGLVCHPSRSGSPERLPEGRHRLPVVVIAHGNHAHIEFDVSDSGGARVTTQNPTLTRVPSRSSIRHEVPSFQGYRYLQEHLAQQGLVSISVDMNVANATGSRVRFRGELVLAALDQLRALDRTRGHALERRLDFSRVALVGHSRGGDGVVMAAELNRARGRHKYGVCSVVLLAPTDFTGMLAAPLAMGREHTQSLFCLYGSHDGDVSGGFNAAEQSPGWSFTGTGFRHYDRCTVRRAMVFVHGATHNRFNTVWIDPAAHRNGTAAQRLAEAQADSAVDAPSVDPRLPTSSTLPSPAGSRDVRVRSAQDHQTLAREYLGGWLSLTLLARATERPLFTGARANSLGVPTALQWKLGEVFRTIDNFDDSDVRRNVVGGANLRPAFVRERLIELSDLPNIPHHDSVLHADAPSGIVRIYRTELPAGKRDFSRFTHLTFRVSKHFPSLATASDIAQAAFPPNLEVTLFDGSNRRSADQTVLAALNPLTVRPYFRPRPSGDLSKVHLQTWQVPLSHFSGPGGVALGSVRAVELRFDAAPAEPIHLDTLSIVRLS